MEYLANEYALKRKNELKLYYEIEGVRSEMIYPSLPNENSAPQSGVSIPQAPVVGPVPPPPSNCV